MKAIASWLSDPFLHLIGVGAVILAIGMGMSSSGESAKGDTPAKGVPRLCVDCLKSHPANRACSEAIIAANGR